MRGSICLLVGVVILVGAMIYGMRAVADAMTGDLLDRVIPQCPVVKCKCKCGCKSCDCGG